MDQSIPKFVPGLSAKQANKNLIAASCTMEKAKQCAILWFGDILERNLFRQLGYSNIHIYAQTELGWSQSKIYDFLKICRKLEELPLIKKKVASGELGYGKARQVVNVARPQNQDRWLDLALKQPRQKLQQEVRRARRQAKEKRSGQASLLPDKPRPQPAPAIRKVTLEMTATQLARYEALWEKLRKQGGLPADRIEALLTVMADHLGQNSNMLENPEEVASKNTGNNAGNNAEQGAPRDQAKSRAAHQPPVLIHIQQCPDCQQATVATGRGEVPLSPAEKERVQCDATVSQPGKRNKATIAPRVRREVLSRDRFTCQRPGCGHTRYLEVHHIVPRSQGGSNRPENLETLCSTCHALKHRKAAGSGLVKEPNGAYFQQIPTVIPVDLSLGTPSMGTNCHLFGDHLSWRPTPKSPKSRPIPFGAGAR